MAWSSRDGQVIGTVTNTDRMVQLGRKAIESPGDRSAAASPVAAGPTQNSICRIWSARWMMPSAQRKPAANSKSAPGVRIVIANVVAPAGPVMRISRGSSVTTRSLRSDFLPESKTVTRAFVWLPGRAGISGAGRVIDHENGEPIGNAGNGGEHGMQPAQFREMDPSQWDGPIDVNLRGVYLMARECIPMLKEAGAEHGKALIANTSSYAGKHGQGWLSAYSATKFGVVGLSQALHKELSGDGVQVTALCPGFVATDMTDWIEGQVPKDEMIQPEDIAEAVRFLLRTSANCVVPEIQFIRPGDVHAAP